jgi:hypothetical protein
VLSSIQSVWGQASQQTSRGIASQRSTDAMLQLNVRGSEDRSRGQPSAGRVERRAWSRLPCWCSCSRTKDPGASLSLVAFVP